MLTRIILSLLLLFFSCLPQAHSKIIVGTVSQLVNAVNNIDNDNDRTILLKDGNYSLDGLYLHLSASNTVIRSISGNRESVIIDGNYQTTEIFQVTASNITIADITLKRAYNHPIHVMATDSHDINNTLITNVHIIDPGQQAIKINPNEKRTHFANHGQITGCLIELTATGRKMVWDRNGSCYTGGIDAHHADGWIVEHNDIRGFWCSNGLSEHGIHFWVNSSDTVVQCNNIFDCDRGIGFGLGKQGHKGGVIRNNIIYQN